RCRSRPCRSTSSFSSAPGSSQSAGVAASSSSRPRPRRSPRHGERSTSWKRSGVAGSSGCPSSSNPTDNTQRKEASMSVTTVAPDLDRLLITVVADCDACGEEVWERWANSVKLGRWWGPPEYLTTFEPYDLSAGAELAHVRTGPDSDNTQGLRGTR